MVSPIATSTFTTEMVRNIHSTSSRPAKVLNCKRKGSSLLCCESQQGTWNSFSQIEYEAHEYRGQVSKETVVLCQREHIEG